MPSPENKCQCLICGDYTMTHDQDPPPSWAVIQRKGQDPLYCCEDCRVNPALLFCLMGGVQCRMK